MSVGPGLPRLSCIKHGRELELYDDGFRPAGHWHRVDRWGCPSCLTEYRAFLADIRTASSSRPLFYGCKTEA